MKSFTLLGILDNNIIYTSNCWYRIATNNKAHLEGFFTLKLTSKGFILDNLRTLDDYTLKSLSPSIKEEWDKVINYYNGKRGKI